MPIASLELTSPVAVVSCQRRSRYLKSASGSSIAVIASLAGCVGVGCVGLLGAILTATALVAVCFALIRSPWVQRGLDRHFLQLARERRESTRKQALRRAPAARQEQYEQLRRLVEGIEKSDPVEVRRLELEELLDHFVRLVVGHHHFLESLRVANATTPIFERPPTRHRDDIAARRLRYHEEFTARRATIEDAIDSTDDLIRLVAQRTACANLDTLIDGESEVDRRLADLDEVEAALVQLSA